MPSALPNDATPVKRRVPRQIRSRARVEKILDAAGRLVVSEGVNALSTRRTAEQAEVPVASLYQYFADKESILLALVKRDVEEMDAQVAADLGALEVLTMRALAETTMRAFVKIYHRRQSFVVIWLRGRTNPAIHEFCRAHNKRLAAELYEFASGAGLIRKDRSVFHAEIAVEVGDRIFQLAFEDTMRGNELVIEEGIELVCGYLERHATAAGLKGVSL